MSKRGELTEAVFAIDLGAIAAGDANVPVVNREAAPQPRGSAETSVPAAGGAPQNRRCTLRLRFKATREQVFKAFPAIANLADKSVDGKVTVNVEGTSSEGFDPFWLRNARAGS